MRVAGAKRKVMALAFLAALAGLTWITMDAGKIRLVVLILLGGFALRVALTTQGAKNDEPAEEHR